MKKRELLFKITKKDFEVTWFSGSGAGGQHRNKNHNCIRLKHIDSGVVVTGQSHKSREQNKKEALNNLIKNEKFLLWHKKKCFELLLDKEKLKKDYEELCQEKNFLYEVKINGKWTEVEEDFFYGE